MKLLFAYFDFTANGKGGGYRGFGECGLNFSISHDYKVERVALKGEGAPAYVLSRTEKPVGEKLPEEFWGKHIYNVSAIVGGNGLGKSTLIHCLINALYYEQKEEVSVRCPTLLVFETESGRERVLCRNVEKGRVSYEPSGGKKPIVTDEYPFDDVKARSVPKLMLFSNTFSSGDVNMDRAYQRAPEKDNLDQFFNKSLVSAFRHSEEISFQSKWSKRVRKLVSKEAFRSDEYKALMFDYVVASNTISERDIFWHSDVMFQYESFQEARFVFDPQVREMMTSLERGGFHIPLPREMRIKVKNGSEVLNGLTGQYALLEKALNVRETDYDNNENYLSKATNAIKTKSSNIWMPFFADYLNERKKKQFFTLPKDVLAEENVADRMILNSLLICIHEYIISKTDFRKDNAPSATKLELTIVMFKRLLSSVFTGEVSISDRFDGFVKGIDKKTKKIEEHISFVRYLEKNRNELVKAMLPCGEDPSPKYRVELDFNDKDKLDLFDGLMKRYIRIHNDNYFLVFEWGMSSGEKNMLRMLTQLWYLPSEKPEEYRKKEEKEKLAVFNRMNNKTTPCQTLFLFLDEADLTYHPEWQRRFISVLTAVIEKMFPGYGLKNIQIILATHSPLMLGDFPAASTIYLKKGDGGMTLVDHERRHSTFGENLYTILLDSFFMNDTIGEFAKNKINELVEWCGKVAKKYERESEKYEGNYPGFPEKQKQKYIRDYRKYRAVAELLPSGIIKRKLIMELGRCAGMIDKELEKEDKQIRIEALKKELEELSGGKVE